jgi:hypothetical protein
MATEEYILIVFDLHLAVTGVNVFIVATEMQQWVLLALLSSYKMFCTAVNNINVLRFGHVKDLIFLSKFT